MTVDQQAHDDLGAAPPVLGVTHPPQIILALGLEVERGEVVQAQGQAPTGGDVIEQGPGQALAVAPLLGPGQAGLQGAAVGRGRPADLGQDSGGVGLGGRLDQARQNHLLKGPGRPRTASPSPRRVQTVLTASINQPDPREVIAGLRTAPPSPGS